MLAIRRLIAKIYLKIMWRAGNDAGILLTFLGYCCKLTLSDFIRILTMLLDFKMGSLLYSCVCAGISFLKYFKAVVEHFGYSWILVLRG